jgi:glucose/arabinose dehydrogenase
MRSTLKVALAACGIALAPLAPNAQAIGVDVVAQGFEAPVFVTSPPGDDRLFIVDQPGRIWILSGGAILATPFLDVTGLVRYGGERGLLGLAFHPDFARNGRFYVNYTNTRGDTRVVEYQVSSDANVASPSSAREIIGFSQPAANHNGGWLGFGPDGYLYISTGDGGGAGDTFGNGQNPNSLLAKILRIDVDHGDPYAIPPSNPWANGGGVPEAFIWGLRNPWRASFDGNNLYIGDVGQGTWEEIDVIPLADAGANLGWSIMEGAHCFGAQNCSPPANYAAPIYEYSHREGCSVAGGYVYRGAAIPSLRGQYVFGDYCEGFVRSLRYANGEATNVTDLSTAIGNVEQILSFGTDSRGEIYITSSNGRIYKIVQR